MISGPAICFVGSRSTTLFASGLLSDVIQTATGPLMPGGITHWSMGKLIAKGIPPTIMLQNCPDDWTPLPENWSVSPTFGAELVTVSVLVALMPMSLEVHGSLRKPPAIAITSCGLSGMSNACGSGSAPARMFRRVW